MSNEKTQANYNTEGEIISIQTKKLILYEAKLVFLVLCEPLYNINLVITRMQQKNVFIIQNTHMYVMFHVFKYIVSKK